MITINDTLHTNADTAMLKAICPDTDSICFFDIETTGFSRNYNIVYLIGAVYFRNGISHYLQWLAESDSDEAYILSAFNDFLKDFHTLIHFNGDAFDIPFITERAAHLNVALDLSHLESLDLYKTARKCKSILSLSDYKQKTIESFLNFPRTDKLDGKKLIALYKSYVLSKDTDSERLLLLHNSDDLAGLHEICAVLAYGQLYDTALKKDSVDSFKKVFENISMEFNYASDYEGNEITELILETAPVFPFPKALDCKQPDGYCKIFPDKLRLCVPVVNDRVKLFYKDYKNYYYLPEQNCAIHKSVAAYVDKSRRTAATKNTCYTWVEPHTLNTPAALYHFLTAYLWHLLQ